MMVLTDTWAPATGCPPFVAVTAPVSVGPDGTGAGTGVGVGVGAGGVLGVVDDPPHEMANNAAAIMAVFFMKVLTQRDRSPTDRVPAGLEREVDSDEAALVG